MSLWIVPSSFDAYIRIFMGMPLGRRFTHPCSLKWSSIRFSGISQDRALRCWKAQPKTTVPKTTQIPYANHGAGIFTYISAILGLNVGTYSSTMVRIWECDPSCSRPYVAYKIVAYKTKPLNVTGQNPTMTIMFQIKSATVVAQNTSYKML